MTVLASIVLLGGFLLLLTHPVDMVEGTSPVSDDTIQPTAVEPSELQPTHEASSEQSGPSISDAGVEPQSLADRIVANTIQCTLTGGQTTFDQSIPLGAPHE